MQKEEALKNLFQFCQGLGMELVHDAITRHKFHYNEISRSTYRKCSLVREHINALAGTDVSINDLKDLPFQFIHSFKDDTIESMLPVPIESDCPLYHQFYQSLEDLQNGHMLGLRFGLRGNVFSNGLSMMIPYSNRPLNVKVLQNSFELFLNSSDLYLDNADFSINSEDLKKILDEINSNIKQIALDNNADASFEQCISMMYECDKHWVSFVASDDYLIYGDRYSESILDERGISIFEAPEGATAEFLLNYAKKLLENSDKLKVEAVSTIARLHESLLKELKLVEFIPLKLQKSDNCGWTSGAKTIMYSNAVLAFNNYFKMQGMQKDKALQHALSCSRKLYNIWAKDFDRVQSIKEYLKSPNPDLMIIARIYLQSRDKDSIYRKQITDEIESSGLMTDEILKNAKTVMLDNIKTTLKTHRTDSDKKAEEYLDLYLKEGTSSADNLIFSYEKNRKKNDEIIKKIVGYNIFPRSAFKVLKDEMIEKNEYLTDGVVTKLTQLYQEVENIFSDEEMIYAILEMGLDELYSMNIEEIKHLSEVAKYLNEHDDFKDLFLSYLSNNELKLSLFAKSANGLEILKEAQDLHLQNSDIFDVDEGKAITHMIESKLQDSSTLKPYG